MTTSQQYNTLITNIVYNTPNLRYHLEDRKYKLERLYVYLQYTHKATNLFYTHFYNQHITENKQFLNILSAVQNIKQIIDNIMDINILNKYSTPTIFNGMKYYKSYAPYGIVAIYINSPEILYYFLSLLTSNITAGNTSFIFINKIYEENYATMLNQLVNSVFTKEEVQVFFIKPEEFNTRVNKANFDYFFCVTPYNQEINTYSFKQKIDVCKLKPSLSILDVDYNVNVFFESYFTNSLFYEIQNNDYKIDICVLPQPIVNKTDEYILPFLRKHFVNAQVTNMPNNILRVLNEYQNYIHTIYISLGDNKQCEFNGILLVNILDEHYYDAISVIAKLLPNNILFVPIIGYLSLNKVLMLNNVFNIKTSAIHFFSKNKFHINILRKNIRVDSIYINTHLNNKYYIKQPQYVDNINFLGRNGFQQFSVIQNFTLKKSTSIFERTIKPPFSALKNKLLSWIS